MEVQEGREIIDSGQVEVFLPPNHCIMPRQTNQGNFEKMSNASVSELSCQSIWMGEVNFDVLSFASFTDLGYS